MPTQSAREVELLEANNRYQQEARDARAALKGGYQDRVHSFMLACFGEAIAADGMERNHRFLEESLELVQALGCTASEAHQLVDYAFGRPIGEPIQETGGTLVTLAALCNAHKIDMDIAGETELTRCWSKIDKIRAKQAAKPKHGPLPAAISPQPKSVIAHSPVKTSRASAAAALLLAAGKLGGMKRAAVRSNMVGHLSEAYRAAEFELHHLAETVKRGDEVRDHNGLVQRFGEADAAASDLLAALKDAERALDDIARGYGLNEPIELIVRRAKAAIAKAEVVS